MRRFVCAGSSEILTFTLKFGPLEMCEKKTSRRINKSQNVQTIFPEFR